MVLPFPLEEPEGRKKVFMCNKTLKNDYKQYIYSADGYLHNSFLGC